MVKISEAFKTTTGGRKLCQIPAEVALILIGILGVFWDPVGLKMKIPVFLLFLTHIMVVQENIVVAT